MADAAEYIISGGATSTGITLHDSDSMIVQTNGTAISTKVESGGAMLVSGVHAQAQNTKILSGGYETIRDYGVESGGIVNSGGTMNVLESGSAIQTTISGGVACITSGGAMISGSVVSNGSIEVSQNGTVSAMAVNSGCMRIFSGGTGVDGAVQNGGIIYVFDDAQVNRTEINTRGALILSGGGAASGAVVNARGYVAVSSGAVVRDAAIDQIGLLEVFDGGILNSASVKNGGSATLFAGASFSGTLTLADTAVFSVANGAVIDFTIAQQADPATALINNWNLIKGGNYAAYTVTVNAHQQAGEYVLAENAFGFNRSITLKTTGGSVLDTLTVGETKKIGEINYTLTGNAGILSLTLENTESPVPAQDDLDGNNLADVIMTIDLDTHPANGSTGAWLILNDQTAKWGDLSQRNDGWVIFGAGRTSGGKSTADIYVKSSDNVIGAWVTQDGGKVTGWKTVASFDSDTQILGLGDFNGNGQSDLLIRNVNGAVGCYFTGGETTGWNYFQSLGDEWKICGIGDLNGDGRDDVVLKHDAGFAGSWLTQADGTMAWADLDTLQSGFEIVGCGDFNGDGTDDVLLKSGSYYGAWIVQNGNAVDWMGLGDLGGVTVEQIADFNDDGRDDLRVRTESGDLGALLVRGADNLEWKYYGSVGSEWSTSLAALK